MRYTVSTRLRGIFHNLRQRMRKIPHKKYSRNHSLACPTTYVAVIIHWRMQRTRDTQSFSTPHITREERGRYWLLSTSRYEEHTKNAWYTVIIYTTHQTEGGEIDTSIIINPYTPYNPLNTHPPPSMFKLDFSRSTTLLPSTSISIARSRRDSTFKRHNFRCHTVLQFSTKSDLKNASRGVRYQRPLRYTTDACMR